MVTQLMSDDYSYFDIFCYFFFCKCMDNRKAVFGIKGSSFRDIHSISAKSSNFSDHTQCALIA